MPRYLQSGVSNAFAALLRRYRTGRGSITGIWDSLVPVVEADRHWQADRLNQYGLITQVTGDGANLTAGMLVAQELEVLVHRITASSSPNVADVNLFTPLQTYNPAAINPAIHFPHVQPITFNAPAALSRAFGLSGLNAAQQVININGAPHTSVGQLRRTGPFAELFHEAYDPPIRLHPQTSICVQATFPILGNVLTCNFWYSEREAQGDVG